MEYFYKNCIETLFKPFSDIPEFKTYAGECFWAFTVHRLSDLVFLRAYSTSDPRKNEPIPIPMRLVVQFCLAAFISESFLYAFFECFRPGGDLAKSQR